MWWVHVLVFSCRVWFYFGQFCLHPLTFSFPWIFSLDQVFIVLWGLLSPVMGCFRSSHRASGWNLLIDTVMLRRASERWNRHLESCKTERSNFPECSMKVRSRDTKQGSPKRHLRKRERKLWCRNNVQGDSKGEEITWIKEYAIQDCASRTHSKESKSISRHSTMELQDTWEKEKHWAKT